MPTPITLDQAPKLVNRVSTRQSALLEERKKRVELYRHNGIETQRATFSDIGKQDLSAVSASGSDQQERQGQKYFAEEVERVSVLMPSGERVELPRLTMKDRSRVNEILANTDEEGRRDLLVAARHFGDEHLKHRATELHTGEMRNELTDAATEAGLGLFGHYTQAWPVGGVNERSVHDMARLTLLGQEQGIRDFYEQLESKQQLAAELQTDVEVLRETLAQWPEGQATQSVDYTRVQRLEDGTYQVQEFENVQMTREEIGVLIKQLEGEATSISAVGQNEMIQLQWMVHQWKQTNEFVSNFYKAEHDTMRTIIGNSRV